MLCLSMYREPPIWTALFILPHRIIGTRQLGKTYIINRFTDEHFKHKIYINLEETSGTKFLDCYQRAIHWIPETPRPKAPEFQAHFIITSSIPLQMFSQEYHFSCGDVTSISIYPLSFEEFLHSLDQELYNCYLQVDFTDSQIPDFLPLGQIKNAYEVYRQIGGFPEVVLNYLETKNLSSAKLKRQQITNAFITEAARCLPEITNADILSQILQSICYVLCEDKTYTSSANNLGKIFCHAVKHLPNLTKESFSETMRWLFLCDIIGFCGLIHEMDILDFQSSVRCYFTDLGIANEFLSYRNMDTQKTLQTLDETFLYVFLKQRQGFPSEIAFISPALATYHGKEIGYLAQALKSRIRYLLELPDTTTSYESLEVLKEGQINKVLKLSNEKLTITDNIVHLPFYLLERYHFI